MYLLCNEFKRRICTHFVMVSPIVGSLDDCWFVEENGGPGKSEEEEWKELAFGLKLDAFSMLVDKVRSC